MLEHDTQANPVCPADTDDGLRRRNCPFERFLGQDMLARSGNTLDQVLSLVRWRRQNDRIDTPVVEERIEAFDRLNAETTGKVFAPFSPPGVNSDREDLPIQGLQRLGVGHCRHPGAHDGNPEWARHDGKPFAMT